MDNRTKILNTKITQTELELIKQIASDKNMSVSEFLRDALTPFVISRKVRDVLKGKRDKGELLNLIDEMTEYQKQIKVAMIELQNVENDISVYKHLLNDNSIPLFRRRRKKSS